MTGHTSGRWETTKVNGVNDDPLDLLTAVVTVVANEDDLPTTGGTKVGAGEGTLGALLTFTWWSSLLVTITGSSGIGWVGNDGILDNGSRFNTGWYNVFLVVTRLGLAVAALILM